MLHCASSSTILLHRISLSLTIRYSTLALFFNVFPATSSASLHTSRTDYGVARVVHSVQQSHNSAPLLVEGDHIVELIPDLHTNTYEVESYGQLNASIW